MRKLKTSKETESLASSLCVVEMAEDSENKDVGALVQRVRELERELAALKEEVSGDVVRRSKIDKMSSEVVDSNPYRYETVSVVDAGVGYEPDPYYMSPSHSVPKRFSFYKTCTSELVIRMKLEI